jgi:predicted alpha-1,2-mannosidase
VARFSRPFAATGPGWVAFDALAQRTVTMRVGISFVDLAGARRNLEAEAPDFDFDAMRRHARAAWNRALSTVRVEGGSDAQRRTFYTALYHAQLHPNVFTDVDGRYRGFDHRPHRVARGRTQYANFSLWDLYKGENQLLATLQPERYRQMLLSLLDDRRLGGKLPRWGEQDYDAAHMSGDPAIPAIADGVCRGLAPRAAPSLYAAARDLLAARPKDLARLRYLPGNAGTTLEYGVADFALALLARATGHADDAARLRSRSLRYRSLLDPETRWIRPREADGSWRTPFSPTDEDGFQEGNSWQYSWLAPHDARGLFARMGGDAAATERLDHLFSEPPDAQVGQNAFGTQYKTDQYAPGNEHDIQVPWMFTFAGEPWRTAAVTRSLRTVFRPTPAGLPGNDDLGGLSGWYVWNALGISPVIPGAPLYAIGSPAFPTATVDPAGPAPALTIEAPGTSDARPYVRSARLGGRALDRAWLYDSEWKRARRLRLAMSGEQGSWWGTSPKRRPPSLSDSSPRRFGCG